MFGYAGDRYYRKVPTSMPIFFFCPQLKSELFGRVSKRLYQSAEAMPAKIDRLGEVLHR
jgi:hypothetical protein